LIAYALRIFAGESRHLQRAKRTFGVTEGFKHTFARDVLVEFVGIWDTVSSVGWIYDPVILPDEGRNPIIRVGRHAISIDERRCQYHDKLWGKPFREDEPGYRCPQDIKQAWFAGAHSDVGGSYPEEQSGLSKLALEWMLCEANQHGLRIDSSRARAVLDYPPRPQHGPSYVAPDPLAMVHNSLRGLWWMLELLPHTYYDKLTERRQWRFPLGSRRTITEYSRVHKSVEEKMASSQGYCPPNLPGSYFTEPRTEFPPPSRVQLRSSESKVETASLSDRSRFSAIRSI